MIYEPILDVNQNVTKKTYKNCVAITHFHQSVELIYCHKGKLEVTCGADTYEIEKGEIAFCPSYFPHSVKPLNETLSTTYIIPYNYFKVFSDNKQDLLYKKLDDFDFRFDVVEITKKGIRFSIEHIKNAFEV